MKKLFATFLSVITAFASLSFAGCKKETETEIPENGMQLLNGFEDFERDVQLLHLLNRFGTADINRDKKYIRSGNGSLALRPLGYGFSNAAPEIIVKTYSTRFDFGYTDFTNVDKLCISAYNAEDKNVNMGISFVFDNGSMTAKRLEVVGQSIAEWYSLKPGWNDLVMSIDTDYLSLQRGANIDKVYGIGFKFDSSLSFDINDAPEIYLDDLYLHYNENRTSKELHLSKDEAKGVYEVADFEYVDQKYFFSPTAPMIEVPEISIVNAADEGLIAKSGMMLMKVNKKAGLGDGGYPYIYYAEKAFIKAIENVGKDLKTHPENYSFKFDVYNASDIAETVSVDYSVKTATGLRWCATNSSVKIPSCAWGTYECNFGNINRSYLSYLKREAQRNILTMIVAEREKGKAVSITAEEREKMLAFLDLTEEDVLKALKTEKPKQTEFTQTEKDDYILKNYLFELSFEDARELLLSKDVMLSSEFKTLYDCKQYSIMNNPNNMRMLFSKYLVSETKNDRVLYFDNFRIEKTGETV